MVRILNVARPKKFIDLQCSLGGGAGDCVGQGKKSSTLARCRYFC